MKDNRELSRIVKQIVMPMTDDDYLKEVKDLVDMLNSLRLIKDKGQRKWLKAEIRHQLTKLLRD